MNREFHKSNRARFYESMECNALLVLFSGWIDKTHHRNFVPKINFLGKAVYATRFVMPVLFVALIAGAFIFSHRANYVYSSNSVTAIRQNETQLAKKKIEDTFQKSNMLAVVVPAGDYEKEGKLIADVKELPRVESVTGLADIEALDGYKLTSALTPREFSEVAGVSGIVLTKLDGTAKGGIAVAIMDELKLPVLYIGVGEGIEDLQAFDAGAFVDAIF